MKVTNKIQQLKDDYKDSLLNKSEYLNSLIVAYSEQGDQTTSIEIQEFLHKLAGSSGMYGYQNISELARNTMQQLDLDDHAGISQQLIDLQKLLQQHA